MTNFIRRSQRLAAVAVVAALGLPACGDDGNDLDEGAVAEPTADTEATMEERMDESMESDDEAAGDIVDVAASIEDFSTLVAAVEAAGLVETLKGDGPFTVFAPTDAAFESALASLGITAEELLADTETLTSILTYHVVAGEVDAATAISLDGQSAETVNGATVDISVVDGAVMVNDATVTTPDVQASNGIIHVIDTVLLPPSN